jgi:hypothetical protein
VKVIHDVELMRSTTPRSSVKVRRRQSGVLNGSKRLLIHVDGEVSKFVASLARARAAKYGIAS